jgi:hypothetical protein
VAPPGHATAASRAAVVLGAPESGRSARAHDGRRLGPPGAPAGDGGAGRQQSLEQCPGLGRGEGRGRCGSRGRPEWDGRVSAAHVGHGGLGTGDDAPGRARGRGSPVTKNVAGPHTAPSDGLQGRAWTGVPLRVSAMRRLFWRLVLVTQQRVERMLAWSTWRRWHQGMAQYWHDRRRAASEVQL